MSDSAPLWRWSELCRATGAPAAPGPDVSGISIDSRSLQTGNLFVALPGDPGPRFNASQRSTRDGHDYLDAAFDAGAAGALVQRPAPRAGPFIQVPDALDGLWNLGRAARRRLQGRAVAITGSSGKTTAKAFLAAALDAFATPGSLNNHLGVPLSLARTPAQAAFAVYEIGTNHPGEIEPLARLARPDVAMVLNVHPAHIEFFDGMEALRREKLAIARGLSAGDTLVCLDEIDRDGVIANAMTFGRSGAADVRLSGFDGAVASLDTPVGAARAPVPGGGVHRALSVAAAAAALIALNVPLDALQRIADAPLPAGRGNRIEAGGVTLIDDSYNANPASMAAALRGLATAPKRGKAVALLGEMLELGAASERLHAALATACAGIDKVFCVGAGMQALHERLPKRQQLGFVAAPQDIDLDALAAALAPGDMALLKGSNRIFWARDFAARLQARLAALRPAMP